MLHARELEGVADAELHELCSVEDGVDHFGHLRGALGQQLFTHEFDGAKWGDDLVGDARVGSLQTHVVHALLVQFRKGRHVVHDEHRALLVVVNDVFLLDLHVLH